MEYLFFLLCCYGATQIIVYGKIFDKIRPKNILFFHCPMCIGFHVGYIVFFLFWVSEIHLFRNLIAGFIVCSFASSAFSYLFCSLIDDEGIRISEKKSKKVL